jgi:hypothetical protein
MGNCRTAKCHRLRRWTNNQVTPNTPLALLPPGGAGGCTRFSLNVFNSCLAPRQPARPRSHSSPSWAWWAGSALGCIRWCMSSAAASTAGGTAHRPAATFRDPRRRRASYLTTAVPRSTRLKSTIMPIAQSARCSRASTPRRQLSPSTPLCRSFTTTWQLLISYFSRGRRQAPIGRAVLLLGPDSHELPFVPSTRTLSLVRKEAALSGQRDRCALDRSSNDQSNEH